MKSKQKLLWVGHCGLQSGFGRVTNNILRQLARKDWDVSCLAIGYEGDPVDVGWKMYPARRGTDSERGGDLWGLARFDQLLDAVRPDITAIFLEPWNAMAFLKQARQHRWNYERLLVYTVVDGENMKSDQAQWLGTADVTVFPTKFGLDEAEKSGFKGHWWQIGHGVDPRVYRPSDKRQARRAIGLANFLRDDVFLFGNVNMNHQRKRLDLSIEAFSKFWTAAGKPDDAYLYLHTNKDEAGGYDLSQLAIYFGVKGRIVVPAEEFTVTENMMHHVYNAIDVQLTTTTGEGFGLTTLEGMACGISQIVPRFSALADWAHDEARKIGNQVVYVDVEERGYPTGNQINVLRKPPVVDKVAEAMQWLYETKAARVAFGEEGRLHALQDQFSWVGIGNAFDLALKQAIDQPKLEFSQKGSIRNTTAKKGVGPSGG